MPTLPDIAVTIIKPSVEGVICGIEEAVVMGANLGEIRADFIENLRVEDLSRIYEHTRAISGHTPLPLVFTLRNKAESGPSAKAGFRGTEDERLNFYLGAAIAGFAYVDIEDEHFLGHKKDEMRCQLISRIKGLSGGKTGVISSWHDWGGTPDINELTHRFARMQNYCPDIVKIATMARTYGDNVRILQLSHWANLEYHNQRKLIMSMGDLCAETRYFAHQHGNEWVYTCLEGEAASPGQISIRQMQRVRKEMRV